MNFSVVIPLYNKGPYIEAAIQSVMAQTLQPLEVLLVDDGSTDDGLDRALGMHYPCLRVIRQGNAGVAAARNMGIAAAQGDYVCFLDADDSYRPGLLAALSELAKRFPTAGLVATSYTKLYPDGGIVTIPLHASVSRSGMVKDFYTAWCKSSFLCTISLAIHRQVFAEPSFRFPVGERLGEDQDLWFRIAERFPVAFDPVALSMYRMDVVGSATAVGTVVNELPVFERLAARIRSKSIPTDLRGGAKRLYSSQLLNVARARADAHDARGAWALVLRTDACANTLYWLRTVVWLFFRSRVR